MQTEHHRRDNAQCADGLMIARHYHLFDVFQLVENLARTFEINLTRFGQRKAAGCPVEEPRAKPPFEVGDMSGNNCVRDIHRAGRAGKATEIRHPDENPHRLQMIHKTTPACYSFFLPTKAKRTANSPPTL